MPTNLLEGWNISNDILASNHKTESRVPEHPKKQFSWLAKNTNTWMEYKWEESLALHIAEVGLLFLFCKSQIFTVKSNVKSFVSYVRVTIRSSQNLETFLNSCNGKLQK